MFTGSENYKSHLKDFSSMQITHGSYGSYSKFLKRANKLITATYMVTDIMDTNEPLRSKLRLSGSEIISDMYKESDHVPRRISETMSFLGIAYTMGMVSEMNFNILRKEFMALFDAIMEGKGFLNFWQSGGDTALLEFLKEDTSEFSTIVPKKDELRVGRESAPTRIGVQKGGTLLKALSDKISNLSDTTHKGHDVLKNKRRSEIIEILKDNSRINPNNSIGLTITDIKNKSTGVLSSSGDKTIQRELVSMVTDGILKKTGEKRWSKYLLNPN